MELLHEIAQALEAGDVEKIRSAVQSSLDQGLSTKTIIENGLIDTMSKIGVRFKNNEIFIPEVLVSTRAMHAAMDVLKPHLVSNELGMAGKVVLGTVKGDLHDIGKNLVKMMLEGVGFEVHDLGINVPAEEFVKAVSTLNPDILAISALLTTTMPEMGKIIQLVTEAGLRQDLVIMVGGAPVNQEFASGIGADLYARDAGEAAAVAKSRLGR
jgi:5-methyltetrahydrofolate--homocysteine methyltransferase